MGKQTKYFIQDTRTYVGNDMLFWKQGKSGYTTDTSKAGQFPKDEAERICSTRKSDVAWPVDYILDRVRPAVDHQDVDLDEKLFSNTTSFA